MSDLTVGKNGIGPPRLADAVILRPGDAGFPEAAFAGVADSKFRSCEHPGCGTRYLPSVPGIRYCLIHNTSAFAYERASGMVRTPATNGTKEKPMGGATSVTTKSRRCVVCSKEYLPTGNAQKRCPSCSAKVKPPTKPKAEKSSASTAIANLRQKAAPPPVAAPPQPIGTGAGGDLYQQLSARRQQMLDDIAAIDRVLEII